MSNPKLSNRQGYVVEQLYLTFGWSALTISINLEVGRRAIENALRRRGVEVIRRSRKPFESAPELTPAAAKQWFERAATEELAELEPASRQEDGREVFRRRRCQACGHLTAYAVSCSSCGELLDWTKSLTKTDIDAAELRKLEELR